MFKVDSLKVMRAMLEIIKLQEQGLAIQLEMQGKIKQGLSDVITAMVKNKEQRDFLADSLEETDDCEDLQLQATTNFKADHVDAYDSDCDDEAIANAISRAILSPVGSLNDDTVCYDSDILSEVPHYDTYHDSDMLNSNIQKLGYIENIISNNESYDELTSNRNVMPYTDYMLTIGNDEDNYVPLPIQKNDMMLRITLSPREIGSWEQSDIRGAFKKDVIPFSENLKETLKLFEKGFITEVKEMKDIFKQMEDEVDQCSVAKKCFEIEKKQLLINNDRLLEENIASDIMCTYLRLLNEVDNCEKIQKIEDENVSLSFQISENNKLRAQLKGKFSESKMNHNGTSVNTKHSTPLTSGNKLYLVTLLPKSKVIPKVVEKKDLLKLVNSHLTANKIIEKCTKFLAPGLLKIECEPNNAYFKNNSVVHHDYLKVTKEHVATLHEVLEEARALKPFDEHIGHSSKFAERIQELLVVSSTNASGSKPRSDTKNNRISQPSSRSKKNNVEAQPRNFKSSANKNNHVLNCNANVKNVAFSKNSDTICLSCNECLFSTNHDACVV
ncbi:hypothetical protein Tco_1458844 [Tanacetum coccineum]